MAEETTEPQTTPQVVTSDPMGEVNKARRQCVLWAGILFAFEFVGVRTAEEEGKPLVGILENLGNLKSPGAIPWVLLTLLVYFVYRYVIEWRKVSPEHRSNQAHRIDWWVSLGIPAIAVVVFILQRAKGVQLFDLATKSPDEIMDWMQAIYSALLLSGGLYLFWRAWYRMGRDLPGASTRKIVATGVVMTLVSISVFFITPYTADTAWTALASFLIFSGFLALTSWLRDRRRERQQEEE